MSFTIKRVDYYHATIKDRPGEAYNVLNRLAELNVNLYAFTGIPMGPMDTQLTIFPEDSHHMSDAAKKAGINLVGPHPAILVQGDDKLGALAEIHRKLSDAKVNVFASSGVTDGRGSFGYLLYIRPEEFDAAVQALGV